MKRWVKLDRELTEQDVGKHLRQGNTIVEITKHTPRHVYVKTSNGNEFPMSKLLHRDTEIEEEVASAYALWGNSLIIDPSSAAFQYYFDYGVPNNSVSPTPRHDCYLDGHSIVETGTLRSACKHCEQPADWDRESCSWVLKNANN